MCPKEAHRMANSVDPDQTAPAPAPRPVFQNIFKDRYSKVLFLQSTAEWMFTQDTNNNFQDMIDRIYKETSRHLLDVLHNKYKFMEHLKVMYLVEKTWKTQRIALEYSVPIVQLCTSICNHCPPLPHLRGWAGDSRANVWGSDLLSSPIP